MTKKIEKSSMNKLLLGLTNGTEKTDDADVFVEEQPQKVKEKIESPQKKENVSTERICTIVESSKMGKIRAISDKEGVSIKEILNLAIEIVINKYEETHGTIKIKKSRKVNVENVFNIK